MGEIEKAVRKRAKKQNIQRMLLSTVAVAGLLAWAAAAPNTLQLLRYTKFGRRKGKYHVNETIDRLIERGEIKKEIVTGKPMLSLTSKGHIRLARLSLQETGTRRRRWDRRWRIVIFDIPEKYRASRDLLRSTLIGIGFLKLQESVWIYPYDCEDLIALLKTHVRAGHNVLYIVSEHVENDHLLRRQFGLPTR